MAALLLDIEPGDEVIVPSFTFVSTANAFVLRGATPGVRRHPSRHAEPRRRRSSRRGSRRGPRRSSSVHYAGVGCEMDADLRDIAERASGFRSSKTTRTGCSARYKGRPLGIVRRARHAELPRNEELHLRRRRRARHQRRRATSSAPKSSARKAPNRSRFFRGQVDKYTLDRRRFELPAVGPAGGVSARAARVARPHPGAAPADLGSLSQRRWRLGRRQPASRCRTCRPTASRRYHLFYLLLPSLDARQALIAHLQEPRHRRPSSTTCRCTSRRWDSGSAGKTGDCPVTEDVSDRLLRLPFYNDLSPTTSRRASIEASRPSLSENGDRCR